ncbi:hypothetical protein GOBAR_DD33192 [Gossypium barbadense]|nr:hypothetical protein GOBAR_DD33192 [Gossypium barbadense]
MSRRFIETISNQLLLFGSQMDKLEQQGGDIAVIPRSIGEGSNPIAALNVEPDTPPESSFNNNSDPNHDQLLWVVLIGFFFAIIIQSLAANLGVSTGKHLSEFCKAEYPRMVKNYLWILAEIAVIAADIPEVIGTAFGLNILFNISVWAGFLLTGLSTLLLLGLQRYGVRKFEMLIAMLVFVMAGCFFREMSYVKPPASGVVKGMFVPKLNGQGATGDAIALLGAIFMYNIFLHSALEWSSTQWTVRVSIKPHVDAVNVEGLVTIRQNAGYLIVFELGQVNGTSKWSEIAGLGYVRVNKGGDCFNDRKSCSSSSASITTFIFSSGTAIAATPPVSCSALALHFYRHYPSTLRCCCFRRIILMTERSKPSEAVAEGEEVMAVKMESKC